MEDAITGAPPEISSLHMTGPIMGWKYARRKSIVPLTLAAGVVDPAILFFVYLSWFVDRWGDVNDRIVILQPPGACESWIKMAYHHSMQLLLVEDELEIQRFLKQSLTDAGYEVDAATDGRAAAQLASGKMYDVLIVDLGLPDQDGIDLILQLRQSGVSSPVLILSARRSVDDRVKGLEQGGDDYLTKPFALAELLARLRNLLRRNLAASEEASRLRVLDLELDFIRRRASRGGEVLNLSPQEFVLLEYLCRHAGRVVTRSMLLSEVWGMRIQPDTNVVDVHIYRLRGKVDIEGREPLIKTLRGIGYVLKDR